MRAIMIGLIFLALLAAGGTAFLVKRFLDTQVQTQAEKVAEAQLPAPMNKVLVADGDLAAGTTLGPGSLRWQSWPEEAIEKGYTSAENEDKKLEEKFVGAVARRGIAKGTPLIPKLVFKREEPGFLAGALDPGKRAVAVAVTVDSGAAGFVLPGDRVDVILTHDIRKDAPSEEEGESPVIGGSMIRYASETILRDLRVLAVDQKMNDFDETAVVVKTITLEVSPKQAEKLALGKAMGKLGLALRSLATDEPGEGETTFTGDLEVSPALSSVFKQLEEKKAEQGATPKSRRKAPSKVKVKLNKGGQSTTQEF